MFLIEMVTSTACPRWTVAAAAVAATRISRSVHGPVPPPTGSVNGDWVGLGVGVAERGGPLVGDGVGVAEGRVPAPAGGPWEVPHEYETTNTTIATASATTARRRQ
jgi:hypothetical protein